MRNRKKKMELVAERLFLFDPSTMMSVIVTVEGAVTVEDIKRAVEKTYTQNQTTMSKLVLDHKGRLYLEEMSETGCNVFVDERDWQEIMHENERKAFRLEEGELIRTCIIPKGDKTDIYIMGHHLISDGMGLFVLVEDIMNNLKGNDVPYRETTVLTRKGTIRRGDLGLKQRLGLKYLNYKWKKNRRVFTWDDYYRIHESFWKNRDSEIEMKVIEGEALKELRHTCKNLGVSINSYLVTQLMEVHQECKHIGVPLSLRGQSRSISNLVSSVTVPIQYAPDKSFEDNLRLVDQAIRKELHNEKSIYHISQFLSITDPTLVDGSLMHYVMGFENGTAAYMAGLIGYTSDQGVDLGVTNMKELKIPHDYGTFHITGIIPIAPRILSSKYVISISTYLGKMLIVDNRNFKI